MIILHYEQRKKIRYKTHIIICLFFLISPLLALVGMAYFLFEKKDIKFFVAFFMAILSYLFIPNIFYDLSRHWTIFEYVKGISLVEFYYFIKTKNDYIVYILSFILAKIGFSPSMLNGVIAFLTYYIFMSTLNKINNEKKISSYIMCFFVFFLAIDYMDVVSGLRSMLAQSVLLYAFVNYQNDLKTKKCLLLLLLAVMIHFFSLIYIGMYFIILLLRKEKNIKIIFYLSLLIMIIIPNNEKFLNLLSWIPFIKNKIPHISEYIIGSQSGYKYNFNGMLRVYFFKFFNYSIYFLIAIIYCLKKIKIKNNEFLVSLFLLNISFVNLLNSFPIMQARYINLMKFLFLVLLIKIKIKNKKLVISLFLIIQIFLGMLHLYPFRNELFNSYNKILFYNILINNNKKIDYQLLHDTPYIESLKKNNI